LGGSDHAKKRLRIILETLSGRRTIRSACEELRISEAAFHKLRTRVLEEAVQGLEPRRAGRPSKELSAEDAKIVDLEEEVLQLKLELHASRLREEIAITMPHLLKERRLRSGSARKKTTDPKSKTSRKRR
jgi:hypothetical protein